MIHAIVILRKYIDNWIDGESTSEYKIIDSSYHDEIAEPIQEFKLKFADNEKIFNEDGRLYVIKQIPNVDDDSILNLSSEEIIRRWQSGEFDMMTFEYELTLTKLAESTLKIPDDFEDSCLKFAKTN